MSDEVQDFLDEVDYVYNEINKLKTDPEVSTAPIRPSPEARRKRQDEERIARELELQYKGRPGHGDKFTTYEHYCPRCHLEFTVAMPQCSQCGKDTMTSTERREDLTVKVGRLKEERATAVERRYRWENWKKTEAMLYRKTATNYRKWDFFETEEEEELPFVPPDDPAFNEMERDMDERRVRRKADKKRAEELKDRGNELFRLGNLAQALEKYEEAQQVKRDWMILYTNSALVRVKLKDYKKAIEDCTRVLEYCEVFEDGYKRSPELCFKALTRRAMAHRGLANPNAAVDDLTQAITIQKDAEATSLLKRCQEEARLTPAEGDDQESQSIEEVTDAQALITALSSEPELLRFISRGGYQSLAHQVYLRHNLHALSVLESLCSDPSNYLKLYPLTKKVKGDINGVVRLIRAAIKTGTDFNTAEKVLKIVAVATENAEVREELMEQCANARKWKITELLVDLFLAIPASEEAVSAQRRLLAGVSNLCLSVKVTAVAQTPNPGDMKDVLLFKWPQAKTKLSLLLSNPALTAALFSLMCNLAVKPDLRSAIATDPQLITAVVTELEKTKQADVLETGLGVLINCMTGNSGANVDCSALLKVTVRCLSFLKSTDTITQRAVQLVARIAGSRSDMVPAIAAEAGILKAIIAGINDASLFQHGLKVLIQCCKAPGFAAGLPHTEICEKVGGLIKDYATGAVTQEMAGNAALLVCRVVDAAGETAVRYSGLIPTLIETVGQKADVVRKNCALALGRLAKDPSNLDTIRDLHGMDVLRSIAEFVLD